MWLGFDYKGERVMVGTLRYHVERTPYHVRCRTKRGSCEAFILC